MRKGCTDRVRRGRLSRRELLMDMGWIVKVRGMNSTSVASTASAQPQPSERSNLSLWEYVSFTVVHAMAALLLTCLSLQGLYQFGRAFGTLEWLINFKRRRRFAASLERVLERRFTPQERRQAGREFFTRGRCDKLFYLVFDRIPRDKASALLTIGNQQLLDEAVGRGRGVYVALSHHGAHHVIAMLLALRGFRTAGVRDRHEGAMRRYVQGRFDRRYPEFQRMRVIYADSFPRDIYRCFEDGYLLGSAMDVDRVRNSNQKAEEVTIFSERRLFLSGPLRVAIRCQAPVLQAFIISEHGFRYRLEIAAMLVDPVKVVDEDAAVAQAMRTYAANVESHLRKTPSLLTRV